MRIKSQADFYSGVMFTAVGGAFAIGSTSYTTCDQVTDLTSICIITAAALAAVLFLA